MNGFSFNVNTTGIPNVCTAPWNLQHSKDLKMTEWSVETCKKIVRLLIVINVVLTWITVRLYASSLRFFAVSDHHHSTALYSHHHQAAMLQGAMSGPPGEARASSTSSYTAIGASSYPSAGPILSSQVSERQRPNLTNIRTDLYKIWYETNLQGDEGLRDHSPSW